MDWVKDRNKLFRLRPRYSRSEINSIAETKATSFLEKTYGCVKFPLRTEDLKNLVEECVEDLDLYHEFPEDEWDAEGVTIFSPGYLPSIKIASVLTETETRLNRFRSTLAHEGGHVILHSPAYDIEGNL